MKELEIVRILTRAKQAYYNSNTPLMTDAEFDSLEEELRKLDPGHPYFTEIGIYSGEGQKIRHKEPMLSMSKAKNPRELFKWMDKLGLPEETSWIIQPKIDGLSASCYYSGGVLKHVATRGDGSVGQDVTGISNYISDIPKTINENRDMEVRGELYLPKNTSYDCDGGPLRNNCVGLVKRKENRGDLKFVRFVCYQTARWNPCESEGEIIDWLKKNGFHTVEYFLVSGKDEIQQIHNQYLSEFRDTWLYETDGLIIMVNDKKLHEEIDSRWLVDHHHHYAIAIKPPAASGRTRLHTIEWQVSRQGALVPVALFDPLPLGGATLSRASLHNAAFVRSMALHPGDELLIERANDVIPYVRENLSSVSREEQTVSSFLLPDCCPACKSPLLEEGVHLKCSNLQCSERIIQGILYWIKESDMEQVAEATIRQLYDRGLLRDVRDLYKIQSTDLESLPGFGEKKIENFISQRKKLGTLTAPELIGKLGIPLVQQKALKKLGIQSMADFFAFHDDSYVTGQNIISWKDSPGNLDFLHSLLEVVTVLEKQDGEFRQQVCMTGKGPLSRKELQKIIESRGYEFSATITKSTHILLCDDPGGSSSKLQKARKEGIILMSYGDFLKG